MSLPVFMQRHNGRNTFLISKRLYGLRVRNLIRDFEYPLLWSILPATSSQDQRSQSRQIQLLFFKLYEPHGAISTAILAMASVVDRTE
jgi:hypothetical protein